MRATGNRVGLSLGSSNLSLGATSHLHRNLHVQSGSGHDVMEADERARRRWFALFALGIVLHGLAMFNSDLGLDAHVRLNVAMDESTEGQDLAWGKLRLSSSNDQSPSSEHEYDGYIPPWYTSSLSIKTTAFLGVLGVALLAGLRANWKEGLHRFDPSWSSLVMFSPIFLFVSGRGYDEGILAVFVAFGVSGFLFNKGELEGQRLLNVVLMATSLLLVLGWKGFDLMACLGVWLGVLTTGLAWMAFDRRSSAGNQSLARHPWKMAAIASGLVYAAILLIGWSTGSGTLGIISEQPLTYLAATGAAASIAIVVFLLIGFFLWPFVWNRRTSLAGLRGPGITMLASYASVLITGIIAYIAALWTLEAALWDLSLLEIITVLGNNGRYATALLIPVILLIKWPEDQAVVGSKQESTSLRWSLIFLVPLMLFTSIHGQQLWSDDAGASLAEAWGEEDSCVFMVAPETLAMHHMYVIKTHLDLSGTRAIDAYWRTSDVADSFIQDHQACSGYLLVAPNEGYEPDAASWDLMTQGDAPVSMSGGVNDGSWRLYRGSV